MRKRILAWIMIFSMALSMLPAMSISAEDESDVEYITDEGGVEHLCLKVTEDMSELSGGGDNNGWYVMENCNSDTPLKINGDITIVIKGDSLYNGIELTAGDSLTIREDPNEPGGTLTSKQVDPNAAGIGSKRFQASGDLTILSGAVIAIGGNNAAGVGGGHGGAGGNITINGGSLTAISGGNGAAGVGAGKHGMYQGAFYVNEDQLVYAGSGKGDLNLIIHDSDDDLQLHPLFIARPYVFVGAGEPGHVHDWQFSKSSEDTIVATCIGEPAPCEYKGNDTSLTIKAPVGSLVYDGREKRATLSGRTLVGNSVSANDIKYYISGSEEEVRPVNPGNYVAKYTYGDVTISVEFTIQEGPKPTHSHDWSYSVSGATITATCKGTPAPCDYRGRDTRLTIKAPTGNLVYDGKEKTATLSARTLTGKAVNEANIVYYKDGSETPMSGSPIDAGKYVAAFTFGDATAKVEFTISKAEQWIAAPTVKTKSETTVELKPIRAGYGETSYGWSLNRGTEPTNWQAGTLFSNLTENTTYYFFARYAGDDNHSAIISNGTRVTTDAKQHSHDWTYSANGSTITSTCKGTPAPCDYRGRDTRLTILAPAGNLVYDGKEKKATLSARTLTGKAVSEADIEYYKDGSLLPMSDPPVDAGEYVAAFTFGDATAKVEFTISKAEQTIVAPTVKTKSESTVELDPVKEGYGETSYGWSLNRGTEPINWQTGTSFSNLKEKTTYYFFAKYAGDDNHAEIVSSGTRVITDAKTHSHVWEYSVNGATITATCKGTPAPCDYRGNDKTLTIKAPAGRLVYDGREKTATLSARTLTGIAVSAEDILYYKGGSETPMLGTPKDAGSYVAKYTFKDAEEKEYTIQVSYSIAKASQAIQAPTVYSKTDTTVVLYLIEVPGREVEYAYNTSNTAPASGWGDNEFTDLTGSTTYWFFARLKEDDNHVQTVSRGTEVKTDDPPHVHEWTYTCKGANFEAKCVGAGKCDVTDTKLSILKPEGEITRDGSEKLATLSATTLLGTILLGEIKYYSNGQEVRPVEAGSYVAKYTFKINDREFTISVEYTIKPDPERVRYQVPVYNTTNDPTSGLKAMEEKTILSTEYTLLDNRKLLSVLPSGWYVVPQGSISWNNGITVTGDVHLILLDGAEMVANGCVDVSTNKSLTVYCGQKGDAKIQGTGKLRVDNAKRTSVKAEAAIGGKGGSSNGEITINGGDITAYAYYDEKADVGGAGIGGGNNADSGKIIINAGKIHATGGCYAAGIGAGNEGDCNTGIIINGGNVTATGYGAANDGAAGIGGGDRGDSSHKGGNASNITINGGIIKAEGFAGGAGIGGGDGGSATNIKIKGGTIEKAQGGKFGAGIGAGEDATGSKIYIMGGNVTAKGGSGGGAGIGAGEGGDARDITISGAKTVVSAIGGSDGGAGIGGGENEHGGGNGENINILNGATITRAEGGNDGGAGIGGGEAGKGNNINITNATVKIAVGGFGTGGGNDAGAGIGGGARGNGTNITITDSMVTATGGWDDGGAGIGGGENGSGTNITIQGSKSDVTAKGSPDGGAGIGGGEDRTGCDIKILGGKVTATGGNKGGAGIGGGDEGDGYSITIDNATVVATGGSGDGRGKGAGAGIGGGYKHGGQKIYIRNHSNVTATGGQEDGGAGIGGGENGWGKEIYIESYSVVTAKGGVDAAGIGAGEGHSGFNIYIKSSSNVTATGGKNGAGIGGGNGGWGKQIYIEENSVVTARGGANAAGIGAGKGHSGFEIYVKSGSNVTAYGGEDAAGIGGACGSHCNGHHMEFIDCTVKAIGGDDAAGIGGGNDGSGTDITIRHSRITAKSGDDGRDDYSSGIGRGDWRRGETSRIWVSGCNLSAGDRNPPPSISISDGQSIAGHVDRMQYVELYPR